MNKTLVLLGILVVVLSITMVSMPMVSAGAINCGSSSSSWDPEFSGVPLTSAGAGWCSFLARFGY